MSDRKLFMFPAASAPGPTLVITTPASLLGGTVGLVYDPITLASTGGTGSKTWAIISPATMPSGMALSSAGVISGTPSLAGSFSLPIRVTDGVAGTADRTFSFVVITASVILAIQPTTMPNGGVNVVFSKQMVRTGGTGPFVWSKLSGTFPTGIDIGASSGIIGGLPTVPSSGTFSIKVTDSLGAIATSGSFTIAITQAAIHIDTAVLPTTAPNTFFSKTLLVSNGQAPFTWFVDSGKPSWMTLTGAVLSGTTLTAQSYSLAIRVVDALGATDSRTVSLLVSLEGPHTYFDTLKVHANIVKSVSWRNQTQIAASTNTGLSPFWTFYPVASDDPSPHRQDAMKLFKPPKAWFRDRTSYPSGSFIYGSTIAGEGTSGDEGVISKYMPKATIGAGPVNGWTDCTLIWDFYWDDSFIINRGGLNGWKMFFTYAGASATAFGGTVYHTHFHETTRSGTSLARGEISKLHMGPGGVPPYAAGVKSGAANLYDPTGFGTVGLRGFISMANKWHRYIQHIRFAVDGSLFTDWITLTGQTPVGPFDMLTLWAMDEDRAPVRLFYKVPVRRATAGILSHFRFSLEQSNNNLKGDSLQKLDLRAMVAGNTFTITLPAFTNIRLGLSYPTETTTSISYAANMSAAIDAALTALSGTDTITVAQTVVNKVAQHIYTIRINGASSGQTLIGAMTVNTSDFVPIVTVLQTGGGTDEDMDGPHQAYARNLLIFKNLGLDEAASPLDPTIFQLPRGGDSR